MFVVSTTGIMQVGLVLGAIGALIIAWGAIGFLRGGIDAAGRARERVATLSGAILVLVGFLLQLYATRR